MKKYNLLQQDIDILFQSQKELYSKVELLDHNFKLLQTVEGILINDSFTNDATSDIRRTYSCTLHLEKNSYFILKRIQLIDKYIRPYVGYKYMRTGEILWYQIGTFAVNECSMTYDETNHNISISCEDLTCTTNGSLNGKIKDQKIKILADEDLRTAMINICKECGITKYYICDINRTVPYDLEHSEGTYYDILKELVELYSGYEMYFDVNGVFHIDTIPTCSDDDNLIDDDILQPLLIRDNGSFNFTEIYNHIIIYGKEIETDRNITQCTYDENSNTYNATSEQLTAYENLTTYSITLPQPCLEGAKINLNSLGAKLIVTDDDTVIKVNELEQGVYSFRYRRTTDDFLLLGQYQVYGEAWDNNPNSPFNVNNLGYEICNVLQGEDYEKIYTDNLAKQRADYEIYMATRLNDNVSLELINIPWLDVNCKVEYTSHNFNETSSYIIKSISGSSTEGTISVSMIKFYEDYSEIFQQ